MFEIETKNLKISDELNRKIDMICWFVCVKYEFIPGNIKSVKYEFIPGNIKSVKTPNR